MNRKLLCFSLVLLGAVVVYGPCSGASGGDFYEGKTIRFIVGYSAGGGFDIYTRAIARHMSKHIPGNPLTIVENMDGAGSLIAANYVYNKSKPDGLTIGNFLGTLSVSQLLAWEGVNFDARKYEWLGGPIGGTYVCALTTASGITNVQKWKESNVPVKLGSTGRASLGGITSKVLRAALGLPTQIVEGYKGTPAIRLAAEAGEIAGGCWDWESIKVMWRKALDADEVKIVIQITPMPHPDLPNVPVAIELAKSQRSRELIQTGVHNFASWIRPYALPPGTPKDRVDILRSAFDRTMTDPDFLAEAKKSKLDIDPIPGSEIQQTINRLFSISPDLVKQLKKIIEE